MQLLLYRVRFALCLALLIFCQGIGAVSAAEQAAENAGEENDSETVRLQVAEPFIELHTGPGRGFPIFHIVERHDWIDILKRRTDWFRIRTREGKEGWAYITQLEQTFALPGKKARFARIQLEDFQQRRFEFGVAAGDFQNAPVMTIYGGFKFQKNLSLEVSFSQVSGSLTNTFLLDANLLSTPFPDWKASPFFSMGVGLISTEAKSNALVVDELDETTVNAGFGVKWYLTRRFVFRADVREYIGFLGQDFNGEFVEWKLGFSFFF
ncbi:outer membrane beta-barrel protein [Kaarinaea lacus]